MSKKAVVYTRWKVEWGSRRRRVRSMDAGVSSPRPKKRRRRCCFGRPVSRSGQERHGEGGECFHKVINNQVLQSHFLKEESPEIPSWTAKTWCLSNGFLSVGAAPEKGKTDSPLRVVCDVRDDDEGGRRIREEFREEGERGVKILYNEKRYVRIVFPFPPMLRVRFSTALLRRSFLAHPGQEECP